MTQKTKTIIGAGLILIITVAIFLFYWSKNIATPVGENRTEKVPSETEKEKAGMEKPEATDAVVDSDTGIVTEMKGRTLSVKTSQEEFALEPGDHLLVYTIQDGKTILLSPTNLRLNDRISFAYDKTSKKILSVMIIKK